MHLCRSTGFSRKLFGASAPAPRPRLPQHHDTATKESEYRLLGAQRRSCHCRKPEARQRLQPRDQRRSGNGVGGAQNTDQPSYTPRTETVRLLSWRQPKVAGASRSQTPHGPRRSGYSPCGKPQRCDHRSPDSAGGTPSHIPGGTETCTANHNVGGASVLRTGGAANTANHTCGRRPPE